MASNTDNLYVTFVDVDRDLLKVWGQKSRIGATYIERQLLQLIPEFNRTQSPNPSRIHKGMFCFAKYTDDNYYRARVISNVQADSVGVLFVDYGNKDIINISNIRIQEGSEGDVLAKMAEQAEEFYLARVAAPNFGWSKEIISEIRGELCYDEFICQTIAQVGDQKILEIEFHKEDFSNYLVKKQIARAIPLPIQRQMILTYCSLVSNEPQQSTPYREMQRENFPSTTSPPGLSGRTTGRLPKMAMEPNHQPHYEKPVNPLTANHSPPLLYQTSKYPNQMIHNSNRNSPPSTHYSPINPPVVSENSTPPMNSLFNPLLCNQYNPSYQVKENSPPILNSFNKVMIEALAKQIKQYITEDNAKSNAEKKPHHYVNSVLEVGNKYSVLISCIDDGPWSFSVRLISSESELEKLIKELSNCELVNIKPPIILGHPCIGLNEYGYYCRGVIVSVSHSAVKVYFVDYGNTEDLPVSSIFELPPRFFETRVLSQKFSLRGLQKVAYSDDIKRFFSEVVQDKLLLLLVTALEDDNLPTCELFLKDVNIKRILNEKIRDYRTLTQEDFPKVGDSEKVVITWVISPQQFYVQLRKRDSELNSLKNELSEVATKGQPFTFQQLNVGLKCVCHYKLDGNWYRAVITSIDSENAINVFYMDYGNTETVDISLLRRVDSYGLINQMSAQAIQCSLKGFENELFDQDLANKLEALILEKELNLTVISSNKDQICVQLFENETDIATLLTANPQPNVEETVISKPNGESDWDSAPAVESNYRSPPSNFEKKNRFPEKTDSSERKGDRNFRGDKIREKHNVGRHFNDLKSDRNHPRSTQGQFRKRNDDREDWRDSSRHMDEANGNFERGFKKDFNNWNDRKPGDGQKPYSPREFKQGRDNNNWRGESFDEGKKFDGNKNGRSRFVDNKGFSSGSEGRFDGNKEFGSSPEEKRFDGSKGFGTGSEGRRFDGSKGFNTGSERRRFDGNKGFGSGSEGRRFEGNRGFSANAQGSRFDTGSDGRRFERRNQDWNSNDFETKKKFNYDRGDRNDRGDRKERGDRFDEPFAGRDKKMDETKSFRKPIKKEDAAPSGSKFEKRSLEIGSFEKGIVTYYFNPHEFFVQLLTQEEEFKQLMKDIQIYYSDKYSLRDPVQAGDVVIAQFSLDKILYRAEVVKASPVTVRYVDYGNQEPVPPKGFWLVDKQFLNLPEQVFRCRLANIQPIGLDWPPPGTEIDKFFESEEFKCTFLKFENGIYEITMEDLKTGKDVASEIIAAGLAKETAAVIDVPEIDYSLLPKQIIRLCISHVDCSNKFYIVLNPESVKAIEEELKSLTDKKESLKPLPESSLQPQTTCLVMDGEMLCRGTIVEKVDNQVAVWLMDNGRRVQISCDKVMELPEHLQHIKQQAVECSLYGISDSSLNEEEFKNSVENKEYLVSVVSANDHKLEVVLFNENGEKIDVQNSVENYDKLESILELPIVGQKTPVMVTHLETPKEIYIVRTADNDTLVTLSEQLSEFYTEKDGLDIGNEEAEGLLVAVNSVVYSTWYRGRVISFSSDGIEVFYIDYGNKEILPQENVKKLDPSFYKLHALARKVGLDIEYMEASIEEINGKILEFTQDKELLGYFINNGGEFLSEFIINGERLSSSLQCSELVSSSEEDKFGKILPGKPTSVSNQVSSVEKNYGVSLIEKIQEETASDDLRVFVSHIDNPKQFWVHKEGDISNLQLFQDKLQKLCKNLPDKQNVQVHDIVAAVFSDMWYRAEVLNVEDNNLTVRFIDYGNVLDFDLNNSPVKELTPEIINIPIFATQYSLQGSWNEAATSKFEAIILQHEDPVSVMIFEEGDHTVVDLLQKGQSIVEKLLLEGVGSAGDDENDSTTVYITHCLSPEDFYIQRESCTDTLNNLTQRLLDFESLQNASSVQENEIYAAKFADDEAWYRARVVKKHSDEFEVLFIDYGNSAVVTEMKNLPSDLVGIPDLAENCCLIYGNNIDDWSEAACEKFSEYADGKPLKMNVVVNRPKKPIVKLFYEEIDLSEELAGLCDEDNRTEVFVSHASSPTDFYIQYADDENYITVLDSLQNGSELEDLNEPKPGSLCAALFEEDGSWYRARITQNLDEGCEVFFIDFGNVSVSTELKKLPREIEDIPPRALRCSLDLVEKNIPESVKEEFMDLTGGGGTVFRARIITPGEPNIVSLKLNGRILEKTLGLSLFAEENESIPPWNLSRTLDDETDDDKNSMMNVTTETYLSSNVEDDVRAGSSMRNETDEEKRVKIAIADGSSEGFKSDDEKGIAEGTVLSSLVNATDNELIEEIQENNEEVVVEEPAEDEEEPLNENVAEEEENEFAEGSSNDTEIFTDAQTNETLNLEDKTEIDTVDISDPEVDNKQVPRNAADKIVPGSVSRGETEKDFNKNILIKYQKTNHSEKVVPGSISMGTSLESIPTLEESTAEVPQRETSQSAPNTPNPSRRVDYVKLDQNDRLVPGCISAGIPVHCSPTGEKVSPVDKIVPGSVSGSVVDN